MPRLTPEEIEDKPHLQDIDIRKGIRTLPGWVFVGADYQAMEVRLTAALSGDENMQQLLRDGSDMHSYMARHTFDIGWTLTDKEFKNAYPLQRQMAKIAGFAIIYGGTSYTLVQNFGMTENEADMLIAGYFKAFPGVKTWMDEVYNTLERDHQVVYPEFGYVRRMDAQPPRNWKEQRQWRAALRSCQNSLIQGLGALWVKRALVRIDQRLKEEGLRAFVSYQIHDEIGCQAPEDEAERVLAIMTECMEGSIMGVDLPVEGEITQNMSKSAQNLLELA